MENENSVTNVTENVEQTTEQNVAQKEEQNGRFYTNEELDKMLAERYNRGRRKAEKESRKKYGKIENILKSGLEVDNLADAEEKLEKFYTEQGVKIPSYSDYDDDDIRTLANKDAEDIISEGEMAVESELRRLSDLGNDKMSKREKAMFKTLYQSHKESKERQELEEIGVGTDLLDSEDFKDFTKKLNTNLTLKEKYEFYKQTHPTQKVEPIGSMNNTEAGNSFKDSYTPEEISKLSLDDLSDDRVWDAVRKSMTRKG